jgi:lysozyme
VEADPKSGVNRRKAAALVLATALAVPMEGIRQYAYYDPPGILTVCDGHTGSDVVKNRKYSLSECSAFMSKDMNLAVNEVDACAPGLPEEVLAAMADAAYNIGPSVACDTKKSSVARALKLHKLKDACMAILKYNKARIAGILVALPGLTKRRQAESDLCMKGAT